MRYWKLFVSITSPLLVLAPLGVAHHSVAAYDQTVTKMASGILKEFDWNSPHAGALVAYKNEKGEAVEVYATTLRRYSSFTRALPPRISNRDRSGVGMAPGAQREYRRALGQPDARRRPRCPGRWPARPANRSASGAEAERRCGGEISENCKPEEAGRVGYRRDHAPGNRCPSPLRASRTWRASGNSRSRGRPSSQPITSRYRLPRRAVRNTNRTSSRRLRAMTISTRRCRAARRPACLA